MASGTALTPIAVAAPPTTHTVTIDGSRFDPSTLAVKAGDTVVWVNKDPFPHTSTSKAGGFDSQTIAAGKSWTLTAAKKGDLRLHVHVPSDDERDAAGELIPAE